MLVRRTARIPYLVAAAAIVFAGLGFVAGPMVADAMSGAARPTAAQDRAEVARLDTAFQAATKRNDAAAIEKALDEDYVLVVGRGAVFTREDLIDSAVKKDVTYELQDEVPGTQTVRVYGDTAVVTALLRLKGVQESGPFDRTLWFSDTYVRRSNGWRYVFGQSSLDLPDEKAKS